MTDRPAVLQKFQLFPETSYAGTATPTRLLRSWTTTLSPQAEVSELRASGSKAITFTALNREWTEISADIEPDYNEIPYVYASGLNSPGTATLAGTSVGGTAYTWTFTPNSSALDTHQTYTCEYGDANHANQVAGVQVTGFTMDIGRDDMAMTADLIGQRMNAITLGTAAAFIGASQQPILPSQVDIFMDGTYASIGTTKLTRDMHVAISAADLAGPIWPINSALGSFGALIEGEQTHEVVLTTGADAGTAGMGGTSMYNTLRGGSTVYLRCQALGGTIGSGTHRYQWIQDYALQVVSAPSPDNNDNLYVWAWTLRPVHDATMGSYTTVTVKNSLSAF